MPSAQGPARAGGGADNGIEVLLGGLQQRLAFSAALLGQGWVTAHHQTLARKVFARHLDESAFIEQSELPRPLFFAQLGDIGRAQRGDPAHAGRTQQLIDARLSDHAAIAHPHHVREPEARLELSSLFLK